MAVKILAVDDSPTMRQILELTFAGEDAEVTTVESGQQAVDAAASLQPDVVLADVSMTGMDGYAVAQAIKANGGAAVILLSSQHNPYDEAKGKASGVDDHVAKPFDSQVVIDKVTQLAANRPKAAPVSRPLSQTSQGPAHAPPVPSAGSPQQKTPAGGRVSKRTMAFGTSPIAPPQPPAPPKPPAAPAPAKRPVLELADEPEVEIDMDEPVAPAAPKPAAPPAAKPPAAASPPAPAKPPAAPAPAPAPAKPPPAAAPAAKPAPAAAASAATASGGDMAKKLDALGLSKEQVEAVLALSREVVEQVVWEVVPDLAETLIKEEIKRLTQE